jgi:hypothetical protein
VHVAAQFRSSQSPEQQSLGDAQAEPTTRHADAAAPQTGGLPAQSPPQQSPLLPHGA